MSRSRRFISDVSWSLGGQIGLALVNITVIPTMIRGLGVEGYGLYILLNSAASYLPALSLGAGSATVKYLSEHEGAGEGRAMRDILRVGMLMHFATAALGGAMLWALAPRLAATFLRASGAQSADVILVLHAATLGGVFLSCSLWAQAALQGLRRFDLQNFLAVTQGVLMPLGALSLMAYAHGVVAISWWYAALNAVFFLIGATLVLRQVAALPADGPRANIRSFLLFGLSLCPGPLAWIVSSQVDKLFVLRVQQLTSLTLYAVPMSALQRLQVLPASVAAVLLPTLSAASRDESGETLRRIYSRVVRIMLTLLWPAYALLFAFMPQLLSLWLGGRFGDDSVWPARLLVVGQAFGVMAYVPNSVVIGIGRPMFSPILSWIQAGLSLLLWILLVPRWGILGAAAGAAAGQALPALAYAAFVQAKFLGLDWRRFLADCLVIPFTSSGTLLAAAMLLHPLGSTWSRLFILGSAGGLLCYGLVWRLLSIEDRELAISILNRREKKSIKTNGLDERIC